MKIKLTLLGVVFLLGAGAFTAMCLQTKETTLSVSYQMLACESVSI